MDLALHTVRPRPIADVSEALDAQTDEELQRLVDALYSRCCESCPEDHVSYSCSRVNGEHVVRLISGPLRGRFDVRLMGAGATKRDALIDLLRKQLSDDDEDDDRDTYVDELEPEDVGQA